MLNYARIVSLFALVLLITTPTLTAKTLRWKLDPQQKYRVVSNWSTRHVSGASEVINTTACDLVWSINSIDSEGNVEVVQTLSHVKQSLQSPSGTTFQYDSQDAGEAKGTAAKMASYWKPLLGSERTFKLTPLGKILPESETPKADVAENELLGRSFKQDAWREALQRSNLVLPPDDVEAGQTWVESQTVPLPFAGNKLQVTQTYSYAGEQPAEDADVQLDVIQLTTRFQLEKTEEEAKEMADLKIVQQTGSGTIVFDVESSRPVRSKYDQSLTLRLEENGQTIETQMTTSYEMTFQLLPQVEATAGEPGQK